MWPAARASLFPNLFFRVMLVFGGPDGPRASKCLDHCLVHLDETLQVLSRDLPVQMQPCACQANGAQCLSAHLCQAREHVLDACRRIGGGMCLRQPCLLSRASRLRSTYPWSGQDVSVRVRGVEHVLGMRGVVFACRAHLDLAHQLVALVSIGKNLVAEGRRAVFLRSARIHILLPLFGRLPYSRHRTSLTMVFFSLLNYCLSACKMLASNTLSLASAWIKRFLKVRSSCRSRSDCSRVTRRSAGNLSG
jgi:hypothetical protein